ncbi:MAG: OB-fold domain-containing protein [Deltaproteobacteria bacterium]|nr:OB-fold domain-containing protein [Deltaproteobacteria bacterium]MBI3389039.1 OB-fold domain-containing protein [Deltaproteobacteria bacterium]
MVGIAGTGIVGITGWSTYVPRLRLDRRLINQAWGTAQLAGTRAVANYDEDALTMATEAVRALLGENGGSVRGLYFASASAPYWEKQIAAVIATACDLPRRLFTADYSGSARAGTAALIAALRAAQAGAADDAVVAAADVRVGSPESELEGLLGDAAAAVRVGTEQVAAEFIDAESIAEEFTYLWRIDSDRYVQAQPGRFSSQFGYARDLSEAIGALLERNRLSPKDISKLALYSPDARAASDLAKSMGFDPKTQLTPSLVPTIGCAGSAEAFLQLAAVLEGAKPGDWVIVGSFGEGADALLFRVTDAIAQAQPASRLREWIDAGVPLASYERYLKFRRIVEGDEPTEAIANVLEFKELKQDVRLYGSRCRSCGMVQFPIARVCLKCRGRELEDHRLARRGGVFTFTVDHLIANIEHPLIMSVIDLDGGGRIYLQTTDVAADAVQVGTRVTLTFRRLHEGGGNHNYFWKARPVRVRGDA